MSMSVEPERTKDELLCCTNKEWKVLLMVRLEMAWNCLMESKLNVGNLVRKDSCALPRSRFFPGAHIHAVVYALFLRNVRSLLLLCVESSVLILLDERQQVEERLWQYVASKFVEA